MDIEEHTVRLNGVVVRYLSVGSGPVLLLLHGIGGSAAEWRWLMQELSRDWRIFAPDMPFATGWNDTRGEYTPEHFARFVLLFLRAVRVARAVIVGHSAGGIAAVRLSLDKPDLVRALVLMDSSGLGREIHPAMIMEATPLWGDLAVRLAQTPLGSLQRALLRSCLIFSRPEAAPRKWWAEQYRLGLEPSFLPAALSALRAGTGPLGQRVVFLDRLPEFKSPVLLMWGSLDQVVPLFHAHNALRRLQDGRLSVIHGCGHMPHVERPGLCADEINRFASEALAV